jgi:hypothetical protein
LLPIPDFEILTQNKGMPIAMQYLDYQFKNVIELLVKQKIIKKSDGIGNFSLLVT